MGERFTKHLSLRDGFYTLMARDLPQVVEDGNKPGKHIYGSHPVYLTKEESNNFNMVFLKNPAPIDIEKKQKILKYDIVKFSK